MIFTYYQYTDTSGSTPKEKYNIHQNSIICTGSDGSPRPNQKVYVVNTVGDQKVMKLAFSNFLVENGAVGRYNSCKYEDNLGLTDIKDARYVPGISYNTIDNNYPTYSWHRQTYMCTLKLAKQHSSSERQYLNFLTSEDSSIGHGSFSQFAVLDDHRPTIGEWPSPIAIRTEQGDKIKFYDVEDTSFQYPLYWADCTPKITFIYNLIPDKTYNYKVFRSNGNAIKNIYGTNSEYGTITVEGQIRLIKFSNIRNARDIGGWPTKDNLKRLKYGIILRGSQLTYEPGKNYGYGVYTPAIESLPDRREFYKLGIQKEIDDRQCLPVSSTESLMVRIDENNNPESKGIDYFTQEGGAKSYQGVATEAGYKQFINYLNAMLDGIRNNKPLYVHCQQGLDRTGTQMAVLEALCNISSDSIVKDYELSTLWCSNTYNRFYFQQGAVGDSTVVNAANSTWGKFNVTSNSQSIQGGVQKWFKDNYSKAKIVGDDGQNISNAEDALKYIQDKLLENASLQRKRIAVIGDSQSAFKQGRHGDTIANMWWYKAAKSLNIDPVENLNNNSFGESRITYSNSKSKRGCSLERLQQLKVNGENPDFIYVMMGGNDWGSTAAIGNWNIGDSFPTEYDSKGDEIRLNFKPAYALMLNRMNTLYPDALKICITQPLLSMKYTGGRPFKDWMEAIVDMAKKFNLPVIDLYKLCGQTIWKEAGNNEQTGQDAAEPDASSKYISDMWVHLNPLGQQYISEKINLELQKILYPHMAVIGDSISAYKEYTSNRRYGYEYPKTEVSNPISSPKQMWWYKVSEHLGYNGRVINASASGTSLCVSSSALTTREIPNARALDDTRVNDLYVNPDNLETIIVAIGLNDFRYSVPIGTWNIGDPYPDESASTVDFKPGYASLLNKLKTRYPKAKIYCCNLYKWYGASSSGSVTIQQYNTAIAEVATAFGCTVIDTYQCTNTFNSSSGSSTYMLPDATHPNSKGQQVIANTIIAQL